MALAKKELEKAVDRLKKEKEDIVTVFEKYEKEI